MAVYLTPEGPALAMARLHEDPEAGGYERVILVPNGQHVVAGGRADVRIVPAVEPALDAAATSPNQSVAIREKLAASEIYRADASAPGTFSLPEDDRRPVVSATGRVSGASFAYRHQDTGQIFKLHSYRVAATSDPELVGDTVVIRREGVSVRCDTSGVGTC